MPWFGEVAPALEQKHRYCEAESTREGSRSLRNGCVSIRALPHFICAFALGAHHLDRRLGYLVKRGDSLGIRLVRLLRHDHL